MRTFEATFAVDGVSDAQLPRLEATAPDAMVIFGHGAGPLVSLVVTGTDAVSACSEGLVALRAIGIRPLGLHLDLVNASAIAGRSGHTRQAVSNWIAGRRRSSRPFPRAFASASGGLWRWQDVNCWLIANDLGGDTDVDYLTRDEEVELEFRLRFNQHDTPS